MSDFRDRIVEQRKVKVRDLVPHPANWRTHPDNQRAAMKGALVEVGNIDALTVRAVDGGKWQIVDGHLRTELYRPDDEIRVDVTDLTEQEAQYVLATKDPIGAMAAADKVKLDELLRDVQSGEAGITAMLTELSARVTIPGGDDWQNAMGGLPGEDRAPFQQMTFTLHDEQVETVKQALGIGKGLGDFSDSPNGNSNGNALAFICETFVTEHGQG